MKYKKWGVKSLILPFIATTALVMTLLTSVVLVKQKTSFQNKAADYCSSIELSPDTTTWDICDAQYFPASDTQAAYGCMTDVIGCYTLPLTQCLNYTGCSKAYDPPLSCNDIGESSCNDHTNYQGCQPQYKCIGLSSKLDSFCNPKVTSASCGSYPTRCKWNYIGCSGTYQTSRCQGNYYLCKQITPVCVPGATSCDRYGSLVTCQTNGSGNYSQGCPLGKRCFNVDAYHPVAGCYYP